MVGQAKKNFTITSLNLMQLRSESKPIRFIFCVMIIFSVMVNEAYGSLMLYIVFVMLLGIFSAWPRFIVNVSLNRGAIYFWPLPAFAILSSLWSPIPLDTLRAGLQLVLTVVMGLLVASLIGPRDFVRVLAICCLLVVLASLSSNRYVIDGMTNTLNWSGIYSNKNTMCYIGGYFAICCVTLALSSGTARLIRAAAWIGVVVAFFICFKARSVATIFAVIVAIALTFTVQMAQAFGRAQRAAYIEIATLATLSAAAFIMFISLQFGEALLALVNKDPTLTGRTMLWFWAQRVAPQNYWIGHGYIGFWVQGNPTAEFLWRSMHIEARTGFHFHSLFYEIWVELGVVGLSVAFTTISIAALNIYRWVRVNPNAVSGSCLGIFIMTLILQIQDVQIFGVFNVVFLIFVTVSAYGYRQPKL